MFRHLSALALITFAACNTVESFKIEEKQRPNIVFLFSDDHSTAAISAYGSRINNTPNQERLPPTLRQILLPYCWKTMQTNGCGAPPCIIAGPLIMAPSFSVAGWRNIRQKRM